MDSTSIDRRNQYDRRLMQSGKLQESQFARRYHKGKSLQRGMRTYWFLLDKSTGDNQ